MSNIHTIGDWKDECPNKSPLPNAWKSAEGSTIIDIGQASNSQKGFIPSLCSSFSEILFERDGFLESLNNVTIFLVIIEVILFIVSVIWGIISYRSLDVILNVPGNILYHMGARKSWEIQHGQLWRLVTPIFLHNGIFHLFLNTMSQLGYVMSFERQCEPRVFLSIYFFSGIGGSLLQSIMSAKSMSVGASGAILGVFGCSLAEILLRHYQNPYRDIELHQALFWAFVSLASSFLPSIDTGGHLGGFIVGFSLGCIVSKKYPPRLQLPVKIFGCVILALFVLGGARFLYLAQTTV